MINLNVIYDTRSLLCNLLELFCETMSRIADIFGRLPWGITLNDYNNVSYQAIIGREMRED